MICAHARVEIRIRATQNKAYGICNFGGRKGTIPEMWHMGTAVKGFVACRGKVSGI